MTGVSHQPRVPSRPVAPSDEPASIADHGPTRRSVLRAGAGLGALGTGLVLAGTGAGRVTAAPIRRPRTGFLHGVASGDPMADRVVLWSRITPTPASTPGSGVGNPIAVRWEISTDPRHDSVVASGEVVTGPDSDFTIKVDPTGLSPDTRYHYRFGATLPSGEIVHSPSGTTRTAPAAGADVRRLRFGVVSCSNWEAGYFAAYRHLRAQRDLTAVIHLGDYIYEYGAGEYTGKGPAVRTTEPRHEIISLRDYRIRHGQYKTDPDLAALHQDLPWICTWDDHESANNAWARGAENHDASEGSWATRKAAAERAYFEWMPVRPEADAAGTHLYRRLRFGDLLELSMLDLRTYRDQEVSPLSRDVDRTDRTITGATQMRWLTDGLVSSDTRWRIIGNSVMITPILIPPLDRRNTEALTELLGVPADGLTYNADQWDGYRADRQRLLTTIADEGVDNVVFITGDIHSAWACDVPLDPADYPGRAPVATELVVTSVTSSNIDDILNVPEHTVGNAVPLAMTAVNRHVRWNDFDAHGYSVLTVTPAAAQMDWFFLHDKADARSGQYHGRSYRVPHGVASVRPTAGPVR